MSSQQLCLRLVGLGVLLAALSLTDVSSDKGLERILKKREVVGGSSAPVRAAVAVPASKAKEFLAKLRRPKRNIWDRSRPDVQQWIQQFMYMGFDETRLEADLSYWMDQSRSSDQGRQHHYDENSPIGPRYPSSYRHGANVNYDYY
ncbi:LOW QUALITY PROTEIN: augurin-A [Osmerus mordax]|uniref:Esophageal cancer related gene 4 protein n=1 Tax=Osmerus mordax TaxID=8014 RepID=C1BIX1_OSMMO|nr:Esophageal cancer related gene 4 protein precursor [Osmerus mordax]